MEAQMARTRREVRALGATWNPTILWYAKAVGALWKKDITDKTSWRYMAAVHNFNKQQWINYGYLTASEKLPSQAERDKYWQQCQHQSWYFWPWHRSYLHTFEDIVLDAIKSLGGPADWALPYWNYSNSNDPNAVKIPDAFLAKTLDDGSANPLYVKFRYGKAVDAADVELTDRISESQFTGTDSGPSLGVGGPDTTFSLSGSQEGLVEAAPHDPVHGEVGGRNGLMSYTSSAGLDPIFWLHHANIDRLWEVWLNRDPANKNPKDSAWLKGPTKPRSFALYGPDGQDRPSNPKDVLSTTALGYVYDDISDPLKGETRRAMRLTALQPRLRALTATGKAEDHDVAKKTRKAELLGSNDKAIALGPSPVRSRITLASRPLKALTASFTGSAMRLNTPGEPDRVFLNLEKIRGKDGSGIFDVILHKPDAPPGSKGVKAGSISLFGLEEASKRSGPHGGNGLNKTLEITKAVDAMNLDPAKAKDLDVEIVPRSDVRKEDAIKVGQISVHRMPGK
jgi:tyrosinase